MGTSKLDLFWVGPCEVTSRKGRDTYVVRTDDSTEEEKHVAELKVFKESLTGPSIPLYWSKGLCKSKEPDPSMP